MIYTRMGTGAEITRVNQDGTVDIKFLGYDDGRRNFKIFDLIADGGIAEIAEEINKKLDSDPSSRRHASGVMTA